ncbi:hypothetical protein CDL15_Pgr008275 [Punica granatum]|uniref:Uncharacterized protein n=1 Tax=Punica granatum TaxID=22663 RepID=A0A218XWE7_PUNGR|nr:hypothetical protein CDL15_Pgr008275 [Punica granatum]
MPGSQVSQASQELQQTLIPDHSGYVGTPHQSSSPSAHIIPRSKIPHRIVGASSAKHNGPIANPESDKVQPLQQQRWSPTNQNSQGFTFTPLQSE